MAVGSYFGDPGVDDDNPWIHDRLDAKVVASNLTSLVENHDTETGTSLTVAVNGVYGSGKTFLLQRWIAELKKNSRTVVYYDAWENDGDDDPLISLVETLVDGAEKKQREAWHEGIKDVAEQLVKRSSGGIVDLDKIKKRVTESSGLDTGTRLRRNSRRVLHEWLSGWGSQLIVVIDDLDRCRPSFALELLERVKHILNTPNLVVVFGVNLESLSESVKVVHGNIDAEGYLLRMFDCVRNLPTGIGHNLTLLTAPWMNHLKLHGVVMDRSLSWMVLQQAAASLTARDVERIVEVRARGSYRKYNQNMSVPDMIMSIVKVKWPKLYREARDRAAEVAPGILDVVLGTGDVVEGGRHTLNEDTMDEVEVRMYHACDSNGGELSGARGALTTIMHREELRSDLERLLSKRSRNVTDARARKMLDRWSVLEAENATYNYCSMPSIIRRIEAGDSR